MKNNKGYYSWIHSMKSAAVESHMKGQQMLNEEKAKKIAFDPTKFAAGMPKGPVAHGKPEVDPAVVRAAAQVLSVEPTTPHSISLAGGDSGEYANIRKMKHAEKLAQIAQSQGPVDAKPAGDANDVAVDAEDGVMADPDTKPPYFAWAHKEEAPIMSKEDEEKMIQDWEEEEHESKEEARHWSDYSGRTGEVRTESVNQKISKFLGN